MSEPKDAGRHGAMTLREALHAEWTKLRTVPSTAWLLLTAIVLTVGIGTLATVVEKCPASCAQDTTKLSLTGILLGQAAVAVLAVLVMTGEYSSGMIRITLTAVPRRATALAAKAIILVGVVLAVGAVAVLGSVLAAHFILPGNGFTGAHGSEPLSLAPGRRCARRPARCSIWSWSRCLASAWPPPCGTPPRRSQLCSPCSTSCRCSPSWACWTRSGNTASSDTAR